ncbi:hypothetical protein [Aureibaculum luteum]|uniref:hypothetical protein n=1 Tax=Aureibaculum luteum TaxID=1548456 RepID=UPI000E523046|nr:hypothetical protein [Aureibaculum luteum]
MKPFHKKYTVIILLSFLVIGFVLLKVNDFEYLTNFSNQEYFSINVSKESCLNCHIQVKGFSKFHNPESIGCVSCHLGNPNVNTKDESHQNMVLIPGNLADADATCGKCHTDELYKINHSLMTTNSGLIAVDKFIFGESDSLDSLYHIKEIEYSAADKHLRDLCANCHLGAAKKEFGKITQLSRGGGCNACHLNYSKEATTSLETYLNSNKENLPKMHPSTDIFMTNEHCFGCHSRSSRISTNFQGWHETLLEQKDITDKDEYKTFEDGRIYTRKSEDVHHTKGLLCIDCHSSHEVMGDGKTYLHQEKAVKIQCSDCHFDSKPNTTSYKDLDRESKLVWMHRDYKHTDKQILVTAKDNNPLVNTYMEGNNAYLISKKDGELHEIKKQSEICSRDAAHKNVNCSTCHSQWAPKCIGCHSSFDENDKMGYDLLAKKEVIGQWVEHVFEFGTSQPSMGVRFDGDDLKIEPAIPGMVLTIDNQSYSKDTNDLNTFHRLYAPNAPHTIAKKVRDCKSCHANSEAIGYGKGTLVYNTDNSSGNWQFTPEYALNENDNLPEDAWIPFLKEPKAKIVSTRTDFRPFNLKEQRNILLVGACLQCHAEDSKVMQQALIKGLDTMLLKINIACVLPSYH